MSKRSTKSNKVRRTSTKKVKVPLDPQLDLFTSRSKANKKYNKTSYHMGPKSSGIQKATGIHHDNSDTWELESKENAYSIKPENKLEWYKSLPNNSKTKNVIKSINFHKTNKEKIITDAFFRENNQTYFCVSTNDKDLKFLTKTMSFCKFNKGVTPAGTEGRQDKQGRPMNHWLKLAIFEGVFIKIDEYKYLYIRQGYGVNNERLVSKEIKLRENKDKIRFHIGVGYCKLAHDNEFMRGVVCLSPDYKDETVMDLIILEGGNDDDYVKISVCRDDNEVILYETEYEEQKMQIIGGNGELIDEDSDMEESIPDDNDIDLNQFKLNDNGFRKDISTQLNKIRNTLLLNPLKTFSIQQRTDVILGLKYVTDILNGYGCNEIETTSLDTDETLDTDIDLPLLSELPVLPAFPVLPALLLNEESLRRDEEFASKQLPPCKKAKYI